MAGKKGGKKLKKGTKLAKTQTLTDKASPKLF